MHARKALVVVIGLVALGLADLAGAAPEPPDGLAVFNAMCRSCHRARGAGGSMGPDLSNIGAAMSHTELAEKIRNPAIYVTPGFRVVTLVLDDGSRVRGLVKNEDAFSIQLMTSDERLQGTRRTAQPRSSAKSGRSCRRSIHAA